MKMINFYPNIMNMKWADQALDKINVPGYLSKLIICCCPVISLAKAQLTGHGLHLVAPYLTERVLYCSKSQRRLRRFEAKQLKSQSLHFKYISNPMSNILKLF